MDAPRAGEPWEYSDIDDRGGLLRLEDDRADHVTLFGNVGGGLTGVEHSFTWAPTIANGRGDTSATP